MRRRIAVTALVLCAALAGCGGGGTTTASGSSAPAAAGAGSRSASPSGAITVFAAASLQESFTDIGKAFEAAHPGTKVTFSFGPSSGLAAQITQGAPADVFASASGATMERVVSAGAASGPKPFARNMLAIAVPPKNPARITRLADLARPGVKVALCQPQVPCGVVAAEVLRKSGVAVRPVTLETDVKATLTKVQLGEVDAGLVYVTDVRAAGERVAGVEIPADVNASTTYPIAALTGSGNAATARAFVDTVLSGPGQAVLALAGFTRP